MDRALNKNDHFKGMYKFNLEKIDAYGSNGAKTNLPFWTPGVEFVGMVECFGEVRHVPQTGKMTAPVDVVDIKILQGHEPIKEKYIEGGQEKTRIVPKEYNGEEFSLTLSNKVLQDQIPKLAPLKNKRLLIRGRGKKMGTNNREYNDYVIVDEETAKQNGMI